MDALTIVKQFASFVLQYWPSISSVAVGGLSSVIAGSWAPILSAIAGIAIGKVSAKPVAAIRARLAKRAA